MKRLLILILTVFLALQVLVSCQNDDFNKGNGHYGGTNTDTETNEETDTSTDTTTDTSTDTSTNTNIDSDLITYNGLIYMLKSDNTLKVVGYEVYENMPGSFSVPSVVNGYTVTEIGSYAFNGYGKIAEAINSVIGFTTIRLPETIIKIDKFAFNDCVEVKVQFDSTNSTITREEWVESLIVVCDDEHDENNIGCNCDSCHQVLDTIMSKRPAIGWYRYAK